MRSRLIQTSYRAVFVLLAAGLAVAVAPAQNPTHVITGTVEKVDAGAKRLP